jgi:hypothetical protein
MNYPASISQIVSPNVAVFSSRHTAANYYHAKTGLALPAFDPLRPFQPWMESRPKPADFLTEDSGFVYNVIGKDEKGFWRMESDQVPYMQACVPNMDEDWVPAPEGLIPLRKLGAATDGLEVLVSSPFGVGVADSAHLDQIGLYEVPPDVLAQINAGKYVPPGE